MKWGPQQPQKHPLTTEPSIDMS